MHPGGLDAAISPHLGHSDVFTVVDVSEREVKGVDVEPNIGLHFGGRMRPAYLVANLKPDAVIALGLGPRALAVLRGFGIRVLYAIGGTVRENVEAFLEGRLRPFSDEHVCRHPERGF